MNKTQKQEEEEADTETETVSLITPARRDPKDPRRVVSHIVVVVVNVIEWQQQK